MGLEVFWLELAENKLEDIFGYYLTKASKRVAENLVNGIVDTTIGIENQPKIGQIEISLKHRKEEFRYLVFKNYKIILPFGRCSATDQSCIHSLVGDKHQPEG